MEIVKVEWRLSHGNDGIDNDPNNPMSHAFNSLLNEGRPFEAFSICLYGGEEAEFTTRPYIRWLGIFVLSAGGRVIFFPGLNINPTWIQTTIGKNMTPRQPFLLDHASLEIARQSWHFTSPGSKKHQHAGKTPDLGKGRLLWFGMSIDEKYLKELKQQTVVEFPSPASDTQRRMTLFAEIAGKAPTHIVNLGDGARARFDKGLLHLRVIVGSKGAPLYQGDNWIIPTGAPYLEKPFPSFLTEVPVRFHEVSLSNAYSIQITAFWLPSSLSVPVVFTTPTRI